jgi:integrase
MKAKLSDKFAQTAAPGIYFATNERRPPGFLLRVTPAALRPDPNPRSRSWCIDYRLKGTGVQRRYTIGAVSAWPMKRAWEEAARVCRIVDGGGDPLGEIEEARQAPTMTDLWQTYERGALLSVAPGTAANYAAMWRDWIAPAIGKMKVDSPRRQDIQRLHRQITEAGKLRAANAVKSLCSVLFKEAIEHGMRDDNPAQHVKSNREEPRQRFLTVEEIERLVDVLQRRRVLYRDASDVAMLAILTGSRIGEIVDMRWSNVDLTAATWIKPAARVKQRRTHHLALSPEVVELLQRRLAEREAPDNVVRLHPEDDYVFPPGNTKTHRSRIERAWREFRVEAGLLGAHGARFHDLRHSAASAMLAAGIALPVIGNVLGHRAIATTSRYAHVADQLQRQAVTALGKIVGGAVKK